MDSKPVRSGEVLLYGDGSGQDYISESDRRTAKCLKGETDD